MDPNIFKNENIRKMSNIMEAILVTVKDIKKDMLDVKGALRDVREDLRNPGKLRPLKEEKKEKEGEKE